MQPWLLRLRHDLLKHALWCARDLEELLRTGQPPLAADLRALGRSLLELVDSEGRPVTALVLWQELRAESTAPPAALDAFERAVAAAEKAARELVDSDGAPVATLAAVRALESAFAQLAQSLSP